MAVDESMGALRSSSSRPSSVVSALDALLARGMLTVAFQPIVDVTTGAVLGYEALGRTGPLEEPLAEYADAPAKLLDLAHAHGRLLDLDRAWRTRAIELIAEAGNESARWFLNVDPRIADDPSHVGGFTRSLLAKKALPPNRFVLELSAGAQSGTANVERMLDEHRAQGFGVALDDLGAPSQSLSTLLRVRPDVLKLDRALVREIDRDQHRRHFVRGLVEFCQRGAITLIAEGVEREKELRVLRDAGVRFMQGELLAAPSNAPKPLAPRVATALRIAHGQSIGKRVRAGEEVTEKLLELVEAIATLAPLEPVLRHVTAFAAELLGVTRVTIRLLDESRTRLLVAARAGEPLHRSAHTNFAVGEGLVGWVVSAGKSLRLGDAQNDPRFSAKPGQLRPFGSFLGVPILDEAGCIGVLAASAEQANAFTLEDERRLRLVAGIAAPRLQIARLRRLAMTDPLTCAWNRRALDELLPERATDASVIVADIDRFKSINDRFGHAAGDEVLRKVAQVLASVLRDSDHVVRIGGEEFLMVLHGAPISAALSAAERARAAVMEQVSAGGEPITASFGVATARADERRDALIERADGALYAAKSAGRNRVRPAIDGPRQS